MLCLFGPDAGGAGGGCGRRADIIPSLRLVLTAEALTAPPPAHALELNAELDALCAAARELAVCRAGWLYFCGTDAPLPAAVPRGLLQGTVRRFCCGVLRSEGRAVVRLLPQGDSAVLALQGGSPARMPGDLPALLAPLRAVCDRRRGAVRRSGAVGTLPYPAADAAARCGCSGIGPIQPAPGVFAGFLCGGCGIVAAQKAPQASQASTGLPGWGAFCAGFAA